MKVPLAAIMGAVVGVVLAGSAMTVCADDKPALTKAVYVCPDCHVVALKSGDCACGKAMVHRHLLGTKDGQAMLCECPTDCKCDAAGVKEGKCACGKESKTASCKGMYVCPDGCPEISAMAGKCACGKDMKKVE